MKRRRQVPPGQPENDPTTGSPGKGEPVFLAVGRLRRPHGIAGEMIMDVLTDFPERLRPGGTVYVGDAHEPMRIAGVRGHDRAIIIHLHGFDSPESAGRYRNAILFVKSTELPKLPEGAYYHHQLLGLKVIDESGMEIGQLAEILETGANDVYIVKTPDGKEILIPAIEDVITSIELESREMHVKLPQWL